MEKPVWAAMEFSDSGIGWLCCPTAVGKRSGRCWGASVAKTAGIQAHIPFGIFLAGMDSAVHEFL